MAAISGASHGRCPGKGWHCGGRVVTTGEVGLVDHVRCDVTRDRSTSSPVINGDPGVGAQGVPGKRTLVGASYPVQRRAAGNDADAAQAHALAAEGTAGPAERLPFLDVIQASFGAHDVGGIHAHTDDRAGASAQAMGANAFATGDHVAFGATPDLHTAAHEAAHVVQQRGGVHLDGGVGASGDPYEVHADAVADAVVAGHSAVPLFASVGDGHGEGAAASVVQRDDGDGALAKPKPAEPTPRRLAAGQDYLIEGDASNPALYVSADWVAKNGVARGFTGSITANSHPKIVRPLVEGLAALYPYVKDRADKPLEHIGDLGFEISSDLWTSGEQQLGAGRSVFLTLGLPPTKPVQAFPTGDGVEIYADALYSSPPDGKPEELERARKQLAKDAVTAIEELLGKTIDPALRQRLVLDIDGVIATQRGSVKRATMDTEVLTTYFGEATVTEFLGKAVQGEGGSVIQVPGLGGLLILAKDDEEKKRVIELLKELFGDATPVKAETVHGRLVNFRDIEALFELFEDPRKDELIAMLREMQALGGGKVDPDAWNSARLRDIIANAREQLEMRDADKKLGKPQRPMETTDDGGILPYPVPGELVNLSNELQLGMRAEFEFRDTSTEDPREWQFGSPFFFHVTEVNVHWYALRVDDAGQPIGKPEAEEIVDYIEVREDGWTNDKRFEHQFEHTGNYEIHADVVHSKFQPAHFKLPVEVVTEQERLRRMEHQGSETWGTEVSREDKVFRGVDDNRGPWDFGGQTDEELDKNAHKYARGSRAEGRLTTETAADPAGGVWKERDRLDAEIAEMEMIEDFYAGDDARSAGMRKWARDRRERMETSLDRVSGITDDPEAHPVQIEAHYASRTHGVPTGTLNLVSFFRWKDERYNGELLDNSDLLRSEHFRFRQDDPDFEKMMEKLFDDLTLTYPDGSISFAFQYYVS